MSNYASGKFAIALCDVCGFQYKLKQLKRLIVKGKVVNILACPECWNPDHPQLMLGRVKVVDPIAVRNPRSDASYTQSGVSADGTAGIGSRVIEWGWAPVGGSRFFDAGLTPNALVSSVVIGNVNVEVV